jgi:hypothetical protein
VQKSVCGEDLRFSRDRRRQRHVRDVGVAGCLDRNAARMRGRVRWRIPRFPEGPQFGSRGTDDSAG